MQLRQNDSASDSHTQDLRLRYLGRSTAFYFHGLYRRSQIISLSIITSSSLSLLLLGHRNETTAKQENGQPRLLQLLLPAQNRRGNTSQKQPCICVRRLAFSEEIHFSCISTALSLPDSPVSTKIVCACLRACVLLFFLLPPLALSNRQVMGPFADCEWPLCFSSG